MNPYAPPTSPYAPPAAMAAAPTAPGGAVSELSIEMLRQTRPWVMLMGVLCFIGSAFLLLGGLGMMAMGALASASAKSAAPLAFGVIYIPMAGLYIYPGLKLTKYGGAIGRLLQSRASVDLDAALAHQKSFWKFAGITTIVMIVLYIVLIIGMMAVGVGTAMMLGK